MVRKFLHGVRSPNNWLTIVPVIAFLLIVSLGLLSQSTIAIITNGLDIGGAVLLNFAFIPVWVRLLRRERPAPEAFLFGGALLIVNAIAASRVWSWLFITMGSPHWMINHWFPSFCYLMVGVGIFYLLKIPGEDKPAGYRYIAWGLVLAVIIAVVFLLTQVES